MWTAKQGRVLRRKRRSAALRSGAWNLEIDIV